MHITHTPNTSIAQTSTFDTTAHPTEPTSTILDAQDQSVFTHVVVELDQDTGDYKLSFMHGYGAIETQTGKLALEDHTDGNRKFEGILPNMESVSYSVEGAGKEATGRIQFVVFPDSETGWTAVLHENAPTNLTEEKQRKTPVKDIINFIDQMKGLKEGKRY